MIELLSKFEAKQNKESSLAWYGTKLVWGNEAYLHVIYKPATTALLAEVSEEFEFPESLIHFYSKTNGASLFLASLTCRGVVICGCLERESKLTRDLEASPVDIRTLNRRNRDFVAFGAYGYDGSTLLVDKRSGLVQCTLGRDLTKIRKSWKSIDNWMDDEFVRMCDLFSKDGSCLTNCEGLLPPSQMLQ